MITFARKCNSQVHHASNRHLIFSGGRFGSEEADYFYSTRLRRPYPAYPGLRGSRAGARVEAVGWAAASAMIAILLRLVGEGKFLAAARRASTQVQFG